MELFRLLGTIAIDTAQAREAIDDTTDRAEDANTRTSSAFAGIGGAALKVGQMVATAGIAMGGAWLAAIEGTREYRAQMGLLDSAFQKSGHSSTEAKNTYSDLNAVLGDTEQAVEAAQHIALIADNEKEMNELVSIGTGIFSTFGQSLPLEGMFEAVNHTASLGEVQGSLADALEWSGITVEDFNDQLAKCSNEEERQDLIMKTLKDTYGEAATQYKETNKDVMEARKAQERLTDAFAEFGRIGEPILTLIKGKIADMVTAAAPHLQNLINKVKDVKKWLQENKKTVDIWKAAIVGAATSAGSFVLILKWGSIMGAAKTAITGVRTAVLLLNAAMRANIIGLIVSLVIGLVAAFVTLWKKSDEFRNFWIGLWNKIKSASNTAIGAVKRKFDDFKAAYRTVQTVFGNIQKTISEKIASARDAVDKAVKRIKGFFNFKWSLPKLKLPTFSLKGKFSLDPPSVPKIGIKWNRLGAIFSQPTIFNTRAGLQGVGDGGEPEAVAPISKLQDYVSVAVRNENSNIGRIIIEQNRILLQFLQRAIPKGVYLDGERLVGELVPAIDEGLSARFTHISRGNTR